MVFSEEEIAAFKARREQFEGSLKVDEFVNVGNAPYSPRTSVKKSPVGWKKTPVGTKDSVRSNEWLGQGSPMGTRRSWKVKAVKEVKPPEL